jgi:hypothetical protein
MPQHHDPGQGHEEKHVATPSVWKLASFGELDELKTLADSGAHMDDSDDMGIGKYYCACIKI